MNSVRLLPALLLAAACAPAPATLTDAARDAAAAEVRATTFALQDALNTHEPDAILAFYRLDDDFTYVGCTNYMFGGNLFGTILGTYHTQNPDVTYDLAIQSLQVLAPDVAVVSLQGTGGRDLKLFVTRALRRDDTGAWLIVHEHESWPGCSDPTPPHPGTAPGDTLVRTPEVEGR